MGNLFVKQSKKKPVVALKVKTENNYLLKQIHSGGTGDCHICKQKKTKGFMVYGIDAGCTVFLCQKCYIIGS